MFTYKHALLVGVVVIFAFTGAISSYSTNDNTDVSEIEQGPQESLQEKDSIILSEDIKETTEESSEEISFTDDDVKKISEAFGHLIGKSLDIPGFSFNLDSVIVGIQAAIDGEESPMSESEWEMIIASIQEHAFLEMASQNLSKAESFMTANSTEEGIIKLEPGKLHYFILESGDGQEVSESSSPLIHYTGKYITGEEFGTSRVNDEPISLSLDQTIPGFSKGLVGMKSGEKRRLFIHPEMGYGTCGDLPPNSLLIFDVEIVEADTSPIDINAISAVIEEEEERLE